MRAQRRRREGSGRPSGYTTDLEAVLAEHGDEYRAEARRRRSLARRTLATTCPVSWPTSNAEWVQWLEEHEDTWKEAIRAVKAGVRKAVNQRIVPHADVPQQDPVSVCSRGRRTCFRRGWARWLTVGTP